MFTEQEKQQWINDNCGYCSKLHAYISKQQCLANKRRMEEISPYLEDNTLEFIEFCVNCPGVFQDIPVKKNDKYIHNGQVRCSSCRGLKPVEEFGINTFTGHRKVNCIKCDTRNRERYNKNKKIITADPPMLTCHDDIFTSFNKVAVEQFNLEEYRFCKVYEANDEFFLEISAEKHDDFFTYYKKKGLVKGLTCGARAIIHTLNTEGIRTKFIITPTNTPNTFKLTEK